MNTDMVAAISDQHTDSLLVLFNSEEGRKYLVERRGIDAGLVARLANMGLSSICNMLAAIKTARYYGLGSEDIILTVATSGAAMYGSEIADPRPPLQQGLRRRFGRRSLGPVIGGDDDRPPARNDAC